MLNYVEALYARLQAELACKYPSTSQDDLNRFGIREMEWALQEASRFAGAVKVAYLPTKDRVLFLNLDDRIIGNSSVDRP